MNKGRAPRGPDYDRRITGGESNGRGDAEPLTTLRGAHVAVDTRRAVRAAAWVCIAALVALVVVLYVSGVHKNAQITALRTKGVPVEVTMSGCLGQLGGSGSNAAGYTCKGSFVMQGRRYEEVIPGNVLEAPGTKVAGVAVAGDPPLITTADALSREHASWRVFILPTVLLLVLLVALGAGAAVGLGRRRSRAAGGPPT